MKLALPDGDKLKAGRQVLSLVGCSTWFRVVGSCHGLGELHRFEML